MATIEMTQHNFDAIVDGHDTVFIDFWASWCGPCKAFGPIFEKVSEQFPHVVFAKCNTETERELATHFRIQSIPTLMIFREKIIIFSQPGMVPEPALVDLVNKVLELDMAAVKKEVAEQQKNRKN
ncbi:MAG: thioredoxin [Magnetococcales bacterium]|nr:thioredoxin [Magnetococcales bacterium]